jgi:Glycosyltransferase
MRICLVNALFYPFCGGIEKHMFGLSRELVKQGHDVTIITAKMTDSPEYEVINGVKVHRIPCIEVKVPGLYPPPWVISPLFALRLKRLDRQYNFDLIHLHNRFFMDYDTAAIYAKLAKKPFLITIHNPRPVGISLPITVVGVAYDMLIGRWPFVLADTIISVSDWSCRDISRYGVRMDKMVTIPNAIDVSAFGPTESTSLREQFGIGNSPMLLFVGRMIAQKGIEYLLDAMPEVLKTHPDAKLLLIGKGNSLKSLKRRAASLGIEENAIFAGYLSEEKLKEAYGTCDVFVLPSIVEPFGMVILEAMACHKPVVCTDSGGVNEIVEDNGSGFLVPVKDHMALAEKINLVLSDDALRRRLGERGRMIAEERYDWKQVATRVQKVYAETISRKAHQP